MYFSGLVILLYLSFSVCEIQEKCPREDAAAESESTPTTKKTRTRRGAVSGSVMTEEQATSYVKKVGREGGRERGGGGISAYFLICGWLCSLSLRYLLGC